MPARSQGKLYTQRQQACLVEKDVYRWVFAHDMDPDVDGVDNMEGGAMWHGDAVRP